LNKVEIWSPAFYEDVDAEEVGAMLEEMDIEF
jgi:MraZ protein